MYKMRGEDIDLDIHLDEIGKTYLHLAVEFSAPKICQFLMFENAADPNVLTHNTQMAALHLAVTRMQPAIIELLLLNQKTNIDVMSPLHGTPLHTACNIG